MYKGNDKKYKNKEEFIEAIFNDDNIYNFKSRDFKCTCCGGTKYYRISLGGLICTKCFSLSQIKMEYLPSLEGWEQLRVFKK